MAKNILKEAIADAKAVREVALANAKAALEEAFTPRLQSMLSAKLSEELDEGEDKEEIEENFMEDETNESYMEDKEDLDEEIDLEEILSELELDENDDSEEETVDEAKKEDLDELFGFGKKTPEPSNEKSPECPPGQATWKDGKCYPVQQADYNDLGVIPRLENGTVIIPNEVWSMEESKKDEDEIEEAVGKPNYRAEYVRDVMHKASDIHGGLNEGSEFDLDALLEEINNLEETENEVEEGLFDFLKKKKAEAPVVKGDSNPIIGVDYDGNYIRKDGTMAEAKKENEVNEVLGTAALGVAGIVAAAGGLTALENAAEDPAFKEKYPKVAKALALLQDMGNAAADTKRMEETVKDEELAETQAALETVRTELNEVNLLNSKLLYVNRIFKANNLSEGQKLRVVETLDKAESVKEAKLIYETIKDTFNVANATQTTPKKSIRENFGMASKAAGMSTAPKKAILNESNDMVARMQKLANITIKQ
jgi:hypothetical protein